MNQKNIKRMKYIFSILFFILAFVSILKIYPQIHPLTQTNFVVTKDQAEGIAKEFLNGEISENEQEIATSFIINKELYQQRNELENLGYSSFIQIDKYWEIGITSTKSKKSGLVLYTDGYPEAMNNKSEEFGENNLLKLIKQKSNLSPEYIILELEEKVKDWQGTRPSMDDRTIVIVKRLK